MAAGISKKYISKNYKDCFFQKLLKKQSGIDFSIIVEKNKIFNNRKKNNGAAFIRIESKSGLKKSIPGPSANASNGVSKVQLVTEAYHEFSEVQVTKFL